MNVLDRPALGSFIYVVGVFATLALFPILGSIGFALADITGAVIGCLVALFLTCWFGCWFLASA